MSLRCFLSALESIASKKLSTNSLTSLVPVSPLTDVIIYFNLVLNSGAAFLFIFFNPSNSLSILLSSAPVKILYVIGVLEWGKIKENSFLP